MKKKTLLAVTVSTLALSLMAGIAIHASNDNKVSMVKADADSICFKDYELLDHIGEAYTPEGATGSITLNVDDENDKYILTFDGFQCTSDGVLGRFGNDSSCLLYCHTSKDLIINTKGDSLVTLTQTTQPSNFVSDQYCAYFDTNNVFFQNDPSLSEDEQGKLQFRILSTGYPSFDTVGGTYYGTKCTGNIEVSKCEFTSEGCYASGAYAHKSYGIFLEGNITLKDEGKLNAYGGYALLMNGTGVCEAYGIYTAEGTVQVDSGYFFLAASYTNGVESKESRSCGLYAKNVIHNGGKVEIHSGNIHNAGIETWHAIKEGRGNNIGVICDTYTVNGGETIIWGYDEVMCTSYGVMGLSNNSVFTINSAIKMDIRGEYFENMYGHSKYATVFYNIKLVNPTMHGLGLADDRADWKNGGYTKINTNANPVSVSASIRKLWFATIQGTATALPEESITYDGEEHELFTCEYKEVTDTDAVIMCAIGESEEYTQGIPKFTNAGTYSVKYYFTPNPENAIYCDGYNPSPVQSETFTIYKAEPDLVAPTAKEGLKEDGSDLELINPGSSTTSTVVYRIGEEGEFSEEIPTVKDPGTYTVYYKAAENTNYKESEVGSLQVTVISAHDHNWSYTANGASITASCSSSDCPTTEGLTLTLEVPTGDMHYDGNAKVATLKAGYSIEAFPNPVIKYFKDNTEVTECINVGKYIAKVTFGNAIAMVEFEILGKTIVDPDESEVSIEVDDAVVPDDIELRVEVRTDVAEKEVAEDYAKIQQMLESNEQISKVYDVKLIKIDGGVETEIQPSDIKPGLLITVRMAIPEGIDINNSRILHIHNADDMEFVSDYDVDGNDLVFETSKLSQFAFVTKVNTKGAHGFCFGIILMILNILIALAGTFYVLLRLNILKIEKLNAFKEKMMSIEVLLTFITACALLANFILDLIVLIVHACPFTIIAFILGTLLLAGIMYWYINTRMKGEMTPVEEKSVGKVFKKK